ncbi:MULTISPECIES: Na+/H+ antiporter subunit E [Clostridium]|uniref:Na(+)/H(+) antiporter subunit E n=2 Tax=Clostridium TaxID=1485 RepID=A0A151AM43_9CLOT|nr:MULTISPECIES: Na+/H+ antiporter subunit E [Clostridium]KYH28691.1 Na(+)/H(+) antiporter subunit E [Clostridium colicanis DSM 13634]MBE6044971.1 cation transporter [Clostridium thermopalmarium]PRR73397.1 Na(+)/H(+) antiporter subunit E [Clostridium thermopalmarium DSM 5974]PVZ22117.1 multisubunit sodium/proton antiporter MrpE subunit [Clostridium thermopalmarium DSM 5974]
MTYKVILLYILYWIILSESKDLQTIIIGILLCASTAYISARFSGEYRSKQKVFMEKVKYAIIYVLILLKEIVIANFQVAKKVLSPSMDISPTVVSIKTKLESDFYKTILANSITLTPGTITVSMENDTLTIHCLEKHYIEGLVNSKFEEILLKAEGCK